MNSFAPLQAGPNKSFFLLLHESQNSAVKPTWPAKRDSRAPTRCWRAETLGRPSAGRALETGQRGALGTARTLGSVSPPNGRSAGSGACSRFARPPSLLMCGWGASRLQFVAFLGAAGVATADGACNVVISGRGFL